MPHYWVPAPNVTNPDEVGERFEKARRACEGELKELWFDQHKKVAYGLIYSEAGPAQIKHMNDEAQSLGTRVLLRKDEL